MRSKHKHLSFKHCAVSKWKMDSHLVAVEVSIESRTNQRVELNGFSLDKFWLECLDAKPVKRRGTVQENRMSFEYVFKDIPNNRILPVNYLFSRFYSFYNSSLNQLADN